MEDRDDLKVERVDDSHVRLRVQHGTRVIHLIVRVMDEASAARVEADRRSEQLPNAALVPA